MGHFSLYSFKGSMAFNRQSRSVIYGIVYSQLDKFGSAFYESISPVWFYKSAIPYPHQASPSSSHPHAAESRRDHFAEVPHQTLSGDLCHQVCVMDRDQSRDIPKERQQQSGVRRVSKRFPFKLYGCTEPFLNEYGSSFAYHPSTWICKIQGLHLGWVPTASDVLQFRIVWMINWSVLDCRLRTVYLLLLTTALGGCWLLEQPSGSLLQYFPFYRQFLCNLYYAHGGSAVEG